MKLEISKVTTPNRQCSVCRTPTEDRNLRFVSPLYLCPNCTASKTAEVAVILATTYNPNRLQRVVEIVRELEMRVNGKGGEGE
jgi:hypothetical protein